MHIALWILSFGAAVVLAGFVYQCIGSHRDRRRYAGAGRWVKLEGGNELYLLEHGSGGPTVIFEAGIGATNLNWRHIQKTISQYTATASYDRGGLGFSSRCRDRAHTWQYRGGVARPAGAAQRSRPLTFWWDTRLAGW